MIALHPPREEAPETAARRPRCRLTGELQFGFDEILRLLERRSRPVLRIDVCPGCRRCHVRGVRK